MTIDDQFELPWISEATKSIAICTYVVIEFAGAKEVKQKYKREKSQTNRGKRLCALYNRLAMLGMFDRNRSLDADRMVVMDLLFIG